MKLFKVTRKKILLGLLIVALLLFSSYLFYDDYSHRDDLLPGIKIAGINVGNLHLNKAQEKITKETTQPILTPLILKYSGYIWRLPTDQIIRIQVGSMVRQSIQYGKNLKFWKRTYHRLFKQPVKYDVPLKLSVDKNALNLYLKEVAKEIDTVPVNAAIDASSGTVLLLPSRIGKRLLVDKASKEVTALFPSAKRAYYLPVENLFPQINEDAFNTVILINRTNHTLSIYHREELFKTYSIAVGSPQYPTPVGSFKIIRKRINPTWYNPRNDWSADMPNIIPPGPDNPLGSRAMDLNSPGIRIHGTPNERSIGYSVSHGCIRMKMKEAEDLFSKVKVGTTVVII